MNAPDPRRAELVDALEAIKPGISNDRRSLQACLARLEPPERPGDAPRRDEIERLAHALKTKITPASWVAVAMEAVEGGYHPPISLEVMVGIVEAAAAQIRRKRPACAWPGRQVAGACAAVYFDLARESPPIANYRQLGPHNAYGRLCEAAFALAGLPTWEWAAEEAAKEWRSAVQSSAVQSRPQKTANSSG
jgi:hypothetical protein